MHITGSGCFFSSATQQYGRLNTYEYNKYKHWIRTFNFSALTHSAVALATLQITVQNVSMNEPKTLLCLAARDMKCVR